MSFTGSCCRIVGEPTCKKYYEIIYIQLWQLILGNIGTVTLSWKVESYKNLRFVAEKQNFYFVKFWTVLWFGKRGLYCEKSPQLLLREYIGLRTYNFHYKIDLYCPMCGWLRLRLYGRKASNACQNTICAVPFHSCIDVSLCVWYHYVFGIKWKKRKCSW